MAEQCLHEISEVETKLEALQEEKALEHESHLAEVEQLNQQLMETEQHTEDEINLLQ